MWKGKNKTRLYLAFYDLGEPLGEDDQGDRYHTALVLTPKSPDPQSSQSWIFHVKTSFSPDGPSWTFHASQTRNRNFQLAYLCLLGKCSSGAVAVTGEKLKSILEKVPVMHDQPDWQCMNWVWDAMQRLVDEGIIDLHGSTPQSIWKLARAYVDARTGTESPDLKKAVPTIDIEGNEITSEIGALET